MSVCYGMAMYELIALLIPDLTKLPQLESRRTVFTWGGEEYPQEPLRHYWAGESLFVDVRPFGLLPTFLPRDFIDDAERWSCLVLDEPSGRNPVDLVEVIREILRSQPRWAAFGVEDHDPIEVSGSATIEIVVDKLRRGLQRQCDAEGFAHWGMAQKS